MYRDANRDHRARHGISDSDSVKRVIRRLKSLHGSRQSPRPPTQLSFEVKSLRGFRGASDRVEIITLTPELSLIDPLQQSLIGRCGVVTERPA